MSLEDGETLIQSQRRIPREEEGPKCTPTTVSLVFFVAALVFGGLVSLFQTERNVEIASIHDQFKDIKRPKNLIFLIPDGMGPPYVTLARDYLQYHAANQQNPLQSPGEDDNTGRRRFIQDTLGRRLPFEFVQADLTLSLSFDELLRGTVKSRSWNTLVTDSAASATAYSCGIKTFNHAIGVDHKHSPCPTLMEIAKMGGMMTGLVVTSRITHATPGSFSAHVSERSMESEIAEFQLGLYPGLDLAGPDLLMGGGECYFIPNTTAGSCRNDDKNLFELAKKKYGFTVMREKNSFDTMSKPKLPLIATFAHSHLSYEIDRDPNQQPSLEEMVVKALDLLENKHGFMLLVEASRIDMAGHNNDAAGALHDTLELHRVVARIKDYVQDKKDTLFVMVPDHDTGGPSLAKQIGQSVEYAYYPDKLTNITNSTEILGEYLYGLQKNYTGSDLQEAIRSTIFPWLGISNPTPEQMSKLTKQQSAYNATLALSSIISDLTEIGFATHGHSGVDVNLYAMGPGATKFTANMDNTQLFGTLLKLLGFSQNGPEIRKLFSLFKDLTPPRQEL